MEHSQIFSLRVRRGTPTSRPMVVITPMKLFPRAVARNRVRRQVTEAFRRGGATVMPGNQLVVTVRQVAIPRGSELERALFELTAESGMVIR